MGQSFTKTSETMAKSHLALATPVTVIGTVKAPCECRTWPRKYLTDAQVQKLMRAAGTTAMGIATPRCCSPTGTACGRSTGDLTLGCHRLRPRANPCEPRKEGSPSVHP